MRQEDNYTKVLADVINSASDTCDHLRLKGSRHGNYIVRPLILLSSQKRSNFACM